MLQPLLRALAGPLLSIRTHLGRHRLGLRGLRVLLRRLRRLRSRLAMHLVRRFGLQLLSVCARACLRGLRLRLRPISRLEKQYQITTVARERDYWPRGGARLDMLVRIEPSLVITLLPFHSFNSRA